MLCDRENRTIKDSLVKVFDGNHHLNTKYNLVHIEINETFDVVFINVISMTVAGVIFFWHKKAISLFDS